MRGPWPRVGTAFSPSASRIQAPAGATHANGADGLKLSLREATRPRGAELNRYVQVYCIAVSGIMNVWICRVDEEDHSMKNQQPRQPDQPDQPAQSHVVPPGVRIPQVPPQFITTQRRVYVVPSTTKILLPDQLPQTPMPGQPTQQQRTYVAPSITFISLPQQVEQTPRPQFLSGKVPTYAPTYAPSAGQQMPMETLLPQTPMPSAHVFTAGVYEVSLPAQPNSFPSRPPVSIAGSRSTQRGQSEYGIAETLMGCAVLMAIGIIALVVLYYISM